MPILLRIDHVQIAMPRGEEEKARAFYAGLLDIPEAPKPLELARRGGVWFERDGLKVHLGVEAEFRPALKAHPAFLVRGLAELAARLQAAGAEVVDDGTMPGYRRVYVSDPFGNRLELMEPETGERRDRPMPTIFPVLRYEDARAAIRWLHDAFGFVELFSVPAEGRHVRHAQLALGANVIMVGSVRPGEALASPKALGAATQGLYVCVENVDAHYARARAAGAVITSPPEDTDFGSRDYHCSDPEGHPWTFGTYRPEA